MIAALGLAVLAAVAVQAGPAALPPVQVRELRPGVWLHTSWRALADGTPFPSNGLVVREKGGLLLIDTAWGEPNTAELLRWIDGTLKLPIARAVVTHSHDDRMGGIALLQARGIEVVAQPLTRELAGRQGLPLPRALGRLARAGGSARVGRAEVFYPGRAHSPDNVVVWLPEQRVLFGTCMVRAAAGSSLGNLADADVARWPESARRLLRRYGRAEVVVPGHGDPGGIDLLRHTLLLAEQAAAKPQ